MTVAVRVVTIDIGENAFDDARGGDEAVDDDVDIVDDTFVVLTFVNCSIADDRIN